MDGGDSELGFFDVAVVGLGAMGSMAAWRLAERGARVVGVDAWAPPHDHGSSHGESRITRTAYYEGPWYVPLLRETQAFWRELEGHSGTALLTSTGAAMIGRPECEVVRGGLESARLHRLEHEVLDTAAARIRFPQHVLEDGEVVLVEPAAGLLRPERCIAAALARARNLGARIITGSPVRAVAPVRGGWECTTASGVVRAAQVVLATGCAIGSLLPELAPRLTVRRQVMGWFAVDDPAPFSAERFPVFCHDVPGSSSGMVYGFPTLDGRTVKVAVHGGGPVVDPTDPVAAVAEVELTDVADFVATRLRGVRPRAERAVACRYTETPDRHFVVDTAGGGAIVVSACSGHGFKFSCVLGDVVADLVLSGNTARDITHFSLARPA